MMLGINEKTTFKAARFIAHAQKAPLTIQQQTFNNSCVNHNNLMY
tara:strand:+ start:1210 stop:1344 length:135 start_codon:yes stop_codon:yes gene_type:complete